MSIIQRLLATLATALGALLIVGCLGLWNLNEAQKRFDYIGEDSIPSLIDLGHISDSMTKVRVQFYQHLLQTDPAAKIRIAQSIQSLDREIDTQLEKYSKDTGADATEKSLVDATRKAIAAYRITRDQTLAHSSANDLGNVQRSAAQQRLPKLATN